MRDRLRSGEPVRGEYDRLADRYDRRWARYVARTTAATAAALSAPRTATVLDVGCGTGALLARLARAIAPDGLTGIDLSPQMLRRARAALPPEIPLVTGDASALPFAADTFDCVVSCNVFHYVRRPEAALTAMRRVVRPGGRLVLTDWCHDYWACRVLDRWLRLTSRAHFRTYRASELAAMLEAGGWTDIRIERFRIDWWWGMMTLSAVKP